MSNNQEEPPDWAITTIIEAFSEPGIDTLRTRLESGQISQTATLRAVLLLTEWVQAHQAADVVSSTQVLKAVAELLQLAAPGGGLG